MTRTNSDKKKERHIPLLGKLLEYNWKEFREIFLALFVSVITGILAGILLSSAEEILLMLPGIIIIIPAVLGMRGNIGASLGARLSSALHLGTVDRFSFSNKTIKSNIYASIMLSFLLSFFLAFVAKAISYATGISSISIMQLAIIATFGGIIAGVALVFITIATSFVSYHRGWDPDNITAPIITALGDLFTIPSILLAVYIEHEFQAFTEIIFFIFIGVAGFIFLNLIIQKEEIRTESYRTIMIQSLIVLAMAGIIDAFAGTFLQFNIGIIASIPFFLVLLPAFLEEGGNIGNTLSSRLATKLHLGTLDVSLRVNSDVKKEFFTSYALSIIIFPLTGLFAYIFSWIFGIAVIDLTTILLITLIAGFVLTTIVIITSFIVATVSYKHGLDPDNITIPLVTALVDILGIIILFAVIMMFGIV